MTSEHMLCSYYSACQSDWLAYSAASYLNHQEDEDEDLTFQDFPIVTDFRLTSESIVLFRSSDS
jgi:hypothetical protein